MASADQALAYLEKQVSKGYSSDMVRRHLSKHGWTDKDIDKVFAEFCIRHPYVFMIKDLSKSFRSRPVLQDINLNIKKGSLIGIIGLSGSGKTTFLNIMIGLMRADRGSVLFHDPLRGSLAPVSHDMKGLTRSLGFAPQDPSFYRRLTVRENLDHFASLFKVPKKQKQAYISHLIDLVNLKDAADTLGSDLSGGMQRRLGIACALVHKPSVLILDEPTADLDPVMRREIWNLISDIQKKGFTVVLTTHFLNEVENLCTDIAILHNSSICACGSPEAIRNQYSKNEEIVLELAKPNYKALISYIKKLDVPIHLIKECDNKLIIYSLQAQKVLHRIIGIIEKQGQKIVSVELNRPTLREVFESFVSK